MYFKNIVFNEKTCLDGILVIYGTEHQIAFLLEWNDGAIEILLNTTDGDFNEHFRKIGGSVIIIDDENFVKVIAGNLFPLCGNYYTHINKASLIGIVHKGDNTNQEITLSEISGALIWDPLCQTTCRVLFVK